MSAERGNVSSFGRPPLFIALSILSRTDLAGATASYLLDFFIEEPFSGQFSSVKAAILGAAALACELEGLPWSNSAPCEAEDPRHRKGPR
jgi:hypothetical protein